MLAEHDYPALLLNADFQPVSMTPLQLLPWQKALTSVFLEKLIPVEYYDRSIHCRGSSVREACDFRLPSVVALRDYVSPARPAAFTRAGIFLRDRNRCAYCGGHFRSKELTFDHVYPRSKGGPTSWENVVSACSPCNARKADKTLAEAGMRLRIEPVQPTCAHLDALARASGRHLHRRLHHRWLFYLGLDENDARVRELVMRDGEDDRAFPAGMTSGDYWFVPLEE